MRTGRCQYKQHNKKVAYSGTVAVSNDIGADWDNNKKENVKIALVFTKVKNMQTIRTDIHT